jgi:hypothetical protein
MSSDMTRAASSSQEPARHDQSPCKGTEASSTATLARPQASVVDLAAYRELRQWADAAAWLNSRGYAAAVPASLVSPLRRRGLWVWQAGSEEAA